MSGDGSLSQDPSSELDHPPSAPAARAGVLAMVRLSVSRACLLASIACLASACGGGGGGSGTGGGCGGGGGGGGNGGIDPGLIVDPGTSEFRVTPAFGTPADGSTPVAIEVRLISLLGHPISNAQVELEVTGYGNAFATLPKTDVEGRTSGALTSTAGEAKTVLARIDSGGRVTELGPLPVEFLLIPDNTFFVRTSGSDANGGRSPRDAWRTLDHALASIGPGATLHVGAGTYPGPLTATFDSSTTTPLVIAGDRDGSFTSDAGAVVIDGGGAPWALELLGTRHAVLENLTLSGGAAGLAIRDCADLRVLACRPQENDVGLTVDNADELVVQDCRVSANLQDGLRIAGAQRTRLENNLIYANLACGIVLLAPALDTDVRFNTLYRNGSDHLREEEPGGSGEIEENILAEGGGDTLALLTGSGYLSANNLACGNSDHDSSRQTPDGVIEADPLFIDPFGPDGILGGAGADDDDFRLRPESVAIDLGSHLARDVVLGSHESLATRTT